MSKHIFIEPMDVWMFRDGKPFFAGGDHLAESLFPPYPTVTQGAIRSKQLALKKLLTAESNKIAAEVGTAENFGKLRLRGPYLAKKEASTITRFFPQPADAVSISVEDHTIRPVSPPVALPTGILSSAPTPKLLGLDEEPKKGESGLWLSENNLFHYMDGTSVAALPSKELFMLERRVGVGIDSSALVSAEGMIYEVTYICPQKGVGLLLEFDGFDNWPKTGILQLGGESRSASYELIDLDYKVPKTSESLPKKFKIYFSTPTFFNNGWVPEDWSKFFSGKVELAAAAVGRYDCIGGFDMTQDPKKFGVNRAARKFVPAGSVYYFECKEESYLKTELIQNAISDFAPEIGFGQIIIKEWENV